MESGDTESGSVDPDASTAPGGGSVMGAPGDNTTLVAVLQRLAADGFGHQLIATEGGRIECVECGSTIGAAEFDVAEIRRLEGASDPDDLLGVVAVTCPRCGCSGAVILGYGPAASVDDAAIWAELQDPDTTP